MSLELHRSKENLGGLVHLLTIDMSVVTGDPSHVLRIVNSYGEDGNGVLYQGNRYTPHPYKLKQIKRAVEGSKQGTKLTVAEGANYILSRFIDRVGGSLQDARVVELKVYGVFLDTGATPNSLAYTKRLDHVIDYMEQADNGQEVILTTVNPLARKKKVPSLSFTAGIPNSSESAINIFPAVDRDISDKRG